MAFKLIEAAQDRWRAVNAPHLVALVRAGARFEGGQLVEASPVPALTSTPLSVTVRSMYEIHRPKTRSTRVEIGARRFLLGN